MLAVGIDARDALKSVLKRKTIARLNRASKAEGPIAAKARALGLDAIHRITPLRRQLMQLGLGIR